MYAQIEKQKENKSRAVANSIVRGKNNEGQGAEFADNRTDTVSQRKLKAFVNNTHDANLRSCNNTFNSANAKIIQGMFDSRNTRIQTLVHLNNVIATLNNLQNMPGAAPPLTSAHFAGTPSIAQIDAAISLCTNQVVDYIDVVTGIINPIDALIVPAVVPYVFNNVTTWNLLAVVSCGNFPGTGALNIAANHLLALQQGMLTNNSTAGGAAVGANYHCHANGGTSGFAFRYVRTVGTNNVTPTIYDFARTRNRNIYQWINNTPSNTAP